MEGLLDPVDDAPADGFDADACATAGPGAMKQMVLAQCRRHLATILDNYHDRHRRRAHKGYGTYPDDHLWGAAQAVRELPDAIATTQMSEST